MTMIERVARAMDAATTGPEAGELVISEMFSPDLWRMMSANLARAAIEAMRDPTDEMLDAATRTNNCHDEGNYRAVWQVMTTAALTP